MEGPYKVTGSGDPHGLHRRIICPNGMIYERGTVAATYELTRLLNTAYQEGVQSQAARTFEVRVDLEHALYCECKPCTRCDELKRALLTERNTR